MLWMLQSIILTQCYVKSDIHLHTSVIYSSLVHFKQPITPDFKPIFHRQPYFALFYSKTINTGTGNNMLKACTC